MLIRREVSRMLLFIPPIIDALPPIEESLDPPPYWAPPPSLENLSFELVSSREALSLDAVASLFLLKDWPKVIGVVN